MARVAPALERFFELVRTINRGTSRCSEMELASRFKEVLETLGLHAVLDTSAHGTRKRPDILAYCSRVDADLILPAEVVVEAKKPEEVRAYTDLAEALAIGLWRDKTVPYVKANLSRIRYFVLTSFTEFAFLLITEEFRREFAARSIEELSGDEDLQNEVQKQAHLISLGALGGPHDKIVAERVAVWFKGHLAASVLQPLPLSTVANTVRVESSEGLELFAARLAEIVAGPADADAATAGLFASIRKRLPAALDDLDPSAKQGLYLFVIAQNPAHTTATATQALNENFDHWLDEFVAASIHSLISRLFTLKIVEDLYCVGRPAPLIERELWVINTGEHDGLESAALLHAVMVRMREIGTSQNQVLSRIAAIGAFFDWIETHLDPVLFRALFELFVTSDFRNLEGDLLGRFFEVYSQRINRTRRRALGQYYTPLPIVRFMWATTAEVLIARRALAEVTVLDPAVGSGAFLKEGVKHLAGLPRFWERMVGFDVSPQIMGIAQANLYMVVLAELDPTSALEVRDLRLYTTDTLDPRNGRHLREIAPLFADAAQREYIARSMELSASVKQREHFRVVIGNPPYKNNSALTLAQVAERFPRLLRSSAEAGRAQVRNIRDDYAWFFAAADAYVQERGIICYITSDTYCRKSSYRLLREEVLRHYRVLRLIRLGSQVFQDVSPRISFAIILMERRETALARPDEAESFDYVDIEPVAANAADDELATDKDPRLVLLHDAAEGKDGLPKPIAHRPEREHDFSFFPLGSDVVTRVLRNSVPVSAKTGDRIFLAKWPGIITAFDALLRGQTIEELHDRLTDFFGICRRRAWAPRKLQDDIAAWAERQGIDEVDRLVNLAGLVNRERITYDRRRIKRTFAGSIPNDRRWYPPPEFRCHLYYEPQLKIPRNEHPGKFKGWGTMEQWREPASHEISPKLIFTTSTNPHYGFKAFVVDEEWYVKIHGGTSQQYNYTGFVDPTQSVDILNGSDNNLSTMGVAMRDALRAAGLPSECLLHYIAGIYNSALAVELLGQRSVHDLRIKNPTTKTAKLCVRIGEGAMRLRDLHRLLYDGPPEGPVPAARLETFASASLLRELGCRRQRVINPRFKSVEAYSLPSDFKARTEAAITAGQEEIDELVEELYT